jgi:RNA polymerase sigma factor (sigma-70 family)
MSRDRLQALIGQLRRAVQEPGSGALTDADLLARWVNGRDEAAFEVLLWRHGPMVLSVCRRLLRCAQDAEDAFQATFLALVRKAGSIGKREAVSSWLFKVAYRAALRAGARAGPVKGTDPRYLAFVAVQPHDDLVWRDLRPVLDEEVRRLPERYRVPFILCYLEGKTNEEAAREMGCPTGTVLSRLARARERLRARLTRRGLALTTAALACTLSQNAVSALVPTALVSSTVRAALVSAAGKSAMAAGVSAPVVALTEGVLKAMLMTKMKLVAGVLLAVGMVGGSGSVLTYRTLAAEGRQGQAQGPALANRQREGQDRAEVLRDETEQLRRALEQERKRVVDLEKRLAELRDLLAATRAEGDAKGKELLRRAEDYRAAALAKQNKQMDELALEKRKAEELAQRAELLAQGKGQVAQALRAELLAKEQLQEGQAFQVEAARDDVELQKAQLLIKQAQVEAAKAALEAARSRADRMSQLIKSGAAPVETATQAMAESTSTDGQYRVRVAELNEQQVRLQQAARRLERLQSQGQQRGSPSGDPIQQRLENLERKLEIFRKEFEELRRDLRPPASGAKIP